MNRNEFKKKKPATIRKVIPKGPQISTIIKKPVAAPRTKKSKISTIIQRPVPAPRTKKSKISTIIQRPVPTPRTKKPKISTKKSYILDEPIPEKEIPKGQKILQPSIINNIKNVVKWGKKQVENWGDWLMKGVKWGKKQVENLGENLGEWFMNLEAPQDDETEFPQDDETEVSQYYDTELPQDDETELSQYYDTELPQDDETELSQYYDTELPVKFEIKQLRSSYARLHPVL